MSRKKSSKTLKKDIRFNYFESMLIVDQEISGKLIKKKDLIQKIKNKIKERITKNEQNLLDKEDDLLKTEKSLYDYKASVWDMEPMFKYIQDSNIIDTAIDIGDIIVEIEPKSLVFSKDFISFQLTKMRDNMLPSKKRIGEEKEEIYLEDNEYIGDFVSVLYDCKYSVLMIQSNKYGLTINQIQKYFTLLRRKYIEKSNVNKIIPLESQLRMLIDPSKAQDVLDSPYFKKIRLKGSDFMLDSFIDSTDEGIMGKVRRLIGKSTGINFEIALSVTSSKATDTLDRSEIQELINDFNQIECTKNRPTLEITKKDSDDSNIEVINLLNPRLTNVIKFNIPIRTSVNHNLLFEKMKEEYIKTRKIITRIIGQS